MNCRRAVHVAATTDQDGHDTIYVIANDGSVWYCYRPADGHPAWTFVGDLPQPEPHSASAERLASLPQHPSSKENETPEHVCGLQGFGRGVDGMYDDCPACSHASKIRSLPHD